MRISIIAAMALNNVIGKEGKLPWYLPEDLKRFKELTTGHCVIMGRKTFESIGKALPDRTTIIVTRREYVNFPIAENMVVSTTLDAAIEYAMEHTDKDEIFIAGGAEIYQQVLPLIDRVYLTVINKYFEGDVCFPFEALNLSCWNVCLSNAIFDEGLGAHYRFEQYDRKVNKLSNDEPINKEVVNHPSHYNVGKIECINYIEDLGYGIGFCAGNAIKYIARHEHKGATTEKKIEDLAKAKWCVDRLIEYYKQELSR